MTDATFNFDIQDRASAKIRRIKTEADGAAKSMSNAQVLLRSAGGLGEGGILTRLAEKGGGIGRMFASGATGLGLIGAAALVAGVGLNSFAAASQRAVDDIKEQITWQQRMIEVMERAGKARAGTAAGGINQASDMRQLIGRGGSLDQVRATAASGINYNDALQGEIALQGQDPREREVRRIAAQRLARTGEMTYAEAVASLDKHRGNLSAALLDKMGLRSTRGNRKLISGILQRSDVSRSGDQGLMHINQAVSSSGMVSTAQGGDLLSGATGRAVREQADSTLDPWSVAQREMTKEFGKTAELLTEAGAAQFRLVAMFKDLTSSLGMGEGSEQSKAGRYIRNHTLDGQ